MDSIKLDLEKAYNVINDLNNRENVKIYFSTNENLKELFFNIDFCNKDVFSVLSSSDQVFSSLYLGAKSVDSFDINNLTFYYHYLRKWNILYSDSLYPRDILKDNYFLKRLLNEVVCLSEDEKKAYSFWQLFSEELNSKNLFYYDSDNYAIPYADDLNLFKRILEKSVVNFNHLNMFSEILVDKKYDIVIMSNLIEYAKSLDDISMVKENLNKLLKKNGRAIFTYMHHCPNSIEHKKQNDLFRDDFNFEIHKDYCDSAIGYSYIKK